jgi:hypothetical protein
MKRIICIGNRHDELDNAGPRVYDRLARGARPPDVKLIDGGAAGLDLLRFAEGMELVVFVAAVPEDPYGRDVVIRTADHAPADSGLALLLGAWSRSGDAALPVVWVVGVCGAPRERKIAAAAEWALSLARTGRALRLWRPRELAATA